MSLLIMWTLPLEASEPVDWSCLVRNFVSFGEVGTSQFGKVETFLYGKAEIFCVIFLTQHDDVSLSFNWSYLTVDKFYFLQNPF